MSAPKRLTDNIHTVQRSLSLSLSPLISFLFFEKCHFINSRLTVKRKALDSVSNRLIIFYNWVSKIKWSFSKFLVFIATTNSLSFASAKPKRETVFFSPLIKLWAFLPLAVLDFTSFDCLRHVKHCKISQLDSFVLCLTKFGFVQLIRC